MHVLCSLCELMLYFQLTDSAALLYFKLLTGVKSLPKRLKHCALTTNSEGDYWNTNYGMGHAVSRMFVQSTFNRFDKHMVCIGY